MQSAQQTGTRAVPHSTPAQVPHGSRACPCGFSFLAIAAALVDVDDERVGAERGALGHGVRADPGPVQPARWPVGSADACATTSGSASTTEGSRSTTM